MNFTDIFSKIRKKQSSPHEVPNHWVKRPSCHALMYYKEIESCFDVCPKCSYHMRISVSKCIELLSDAGSFIEFDKNSEAIDPLKFVDSKSYKKRLSEGESKTGRKSSVISGKCTINGLKTQLVVFDSAFMGGSFGSVEGEKTVRAVQRAISTKSSLVTVSASGGARMQESTYSLMQMSKTSAALKLLSKEKLPYISILTDPTFGGASASSAWLGDLIIAEPGALVGFAGVRVIKQTIGADLPEGFQRAEPLLEHGLIDNIIERASQKQLISDALKFFNGK